MAQDDRELEVVLFGATGFTGRLVAAYLAERYGAGTETLRWGLAGRSREKLEAVRRELGAEGLPIRVCDATDPAAVADLAARARVVCTTVGPYARYGSELVGACARAGTHYCDLTGEVPWVRRMIDAHQARAEASGARLVPSCGFDCIPSDLGVHFVQREMRARHGVPAARVKLRVAGFRGGASGGTVASMLDLLEEAAAERTVRQLLADPYALDPEGHRKGPDGPDSLRPAYDPDFAQWTGPFVMGAVNTRVVRRTNALLDEPYGRSFRYDEAVLTGPGPLGLARATGLAAGLGGVLALGALGPVRRLLARRLPAPGEGPSREKREAGWWDLRLLAIHPQDPALNLAARVSGDQDPGYGSTARMLGESAVCLARDPLEVGGGFWTPASALGDLLLGRLEKDAGVTFRVVEDPRVPAPGGPP